MGWMKNKNETGCAMTMPESGSGPPRILLVGPYPPPFGGISIHVFRLGATLAAEGWPVETLATGRSHGAGPTLIIGNSPLRHAKGLLSRGRGVVHVHHSLSPLAMGTVILARLRRCPVVMTLHGNPVQFFSRKEGLDPFWRVALAGTQRVVAVNGKIARTVGQTARIRRKTVVLPAFIPPVPGEQQFVGTGVQRWLDHEARGAKILSAAVTRLLPAFRGRQDVYGLASLASLACDLAQHRKNIALALLLGLPPEDPVEADFLRLHESKLREALGPRLGLFFNEYAPPVIMRSSVFLRPTLTDGDSIAVREALAAGVPVVASDAVPRPEGVVLYRSGDARDLLNKVSGVLDDGGKNGNPEVTGPDCIQPLLSLYREFEK